MQLTSPPPPPLGDFLTMSGRLRRASQRNHQVQPPVQVSMSHVGDRRLLQSELERGQLLVPQGRYVHNVERAPVAAMVESTSEVVTGVAAITSGPIALSTKKEKQWYTWAHRIIPALVGPYAKLLNRTDNLARLGMFKSKKVRCEGCAEGKPISVVCLYFDSGLRKYHY